MKNLVEVDCREFNRAIRSFHIRDLSTYALVAFENGFLIIESGGQLVTARAGGEFHGRAVFSSNLLKALVKVPVSEDPVEIAYDDGKLRIGRTTIGSDWELVSDAFVANVLNPSVLDLLAMDRASPRSEIHATGLAKRIRDARARLTKNIHKAARLLADAEISEDDLWTLVEWRVKHRLETRSG